MKYVMFSIYTACLFLVFAFVAVLLACVAQAIIDGVPLWTVIFSW